MLSATRDGAPVFAKETDNTGVHDARVTNRDTAARVRPGNYVKEKLYASLLSLLRSIDQ